MAVPFDPRRLEVMVRGPRRGGVLLSRNTGAAHTLSAMDRWFMLPEVFRRIDAGWCGSIAMEPRRWRAPAAPSCSALSPDARR